MKSNKLKNNFSSSSSKQLLNNKKQFHCSYELGIDPIFDKQPFLTDAYDRSQTRELIKKCELDSDAFATLFRCLFTKTKLYQKQFNLLKQSFKIFIDKVYFKSRQLGENYAKLCVHTALIMHDRLSNMSYIIYTLSKCNHLKFPLVIILNVFKECIEYNDNAIGYILGSIRDFTIRKEMPIWLIKKEMFRNMWYFKEIDERFNEILKYESKFLIKNKMEELD